VAIRQIAVPRLIDYYVRFHQTSIRSRLSGCERSWIARKTWVWEGNGLGGLNNWQAVPSEDNRANYHQNTPALRPSCPAPSPRGARRRLRSFLEPPDAVAAALWTRPLLDNPRSVGPLIFVLAAQTLELRLFLGLWHQSDPAQYNPRVPVTTHRLPAAVSWPQPSRHRTTTPASSARSPLW
jgi:hypothetical protein